MFEALAQGASHPAVAAWLAVGTVGVAAVVVAMAWERERAAAPAGRAAGQAAVSLSAAAIVRAKGEIPGVVAGEKRDGPGESTERAKA